MEEQRLEEKKQRQQKILLLLLCIFINIIGKYFAMIFQLSIWLDMIGTAVAAYFIGPLGATVAAVCCGLTSVMLNPMDVVYIFVGVTCGILIYLCAKNKYMDGPAKSLITGFGIGVYAAVAATVIDLLISNGYSGNIWCNTFIDMLLNRNVPLYAATFFGEILIEIPDKQLCLLLAYFLIRQIKENQDKNNGYITIRFVGVWFVLLFAIIAILLPMMIHSTHLNILKTDVISSNGTSAIRHTEEIEWTQENYQENVFAGNYIEQIYNFSNGMFSSEANGIAETADGYIWIGSYAGLTRYDGRTFEYIHDSGLASVTCLMTDSSDRLWIGTNDRGVARYENNTFTFFTTDTGMPASGVRAILETDEGVMYIATTDRLCKITPEDEVLVIDADITYVVSMVESLGEIVGVDHAGNLFLLKNDEIVDKICFTDNSAYYSCVGLSNGTIYVGTSTGEIGKVEIHGDSLRVTGSINAGGLTEIANIEMDREGRTWICASNGLGYIAENGKIYIHSYEGFDRNIECVQEDYQGNLWFASSRYGVLKLSQNHFVDIFAAAGVTPDVVNGVCEYQSYYYCGTDNGLVIICKDDLTQVRNDLTECMEDARVRCVFKDSRNNIWVCSYSDVGLACLKQDGTWIHFNQEESGTTNNRFRCITELGDGTIVAGNSNGINIIRNNAVVATITGENGLENEQILTLVPVGDNSFLAGTDGAGIYLIEDDVITAHYSTDDGLSSDIVLRITPYKTGYFVVASNALCFMENGSIRVLDNFPYFNNYDILLYENNAYVLSSSGIYVTDIEKLYNNEELQYKLYNHSEGLIDALVANSWNYFDEDGKIYFCTNQGVDYFDVNHLDINHMYKYDMISVIADGKEIYAENNTFVIPANAGHLSLQASIRNYSLSDVKLSFYIEGFDAEPTIYSQKSMEPIQINNMPAGTYKIIIQILNDDESVVLQNKEYILIKEERMWESSVYSIYLVISVFWLTFSFVWTVISYYSISKRAHDMEEMRMQAKNEFLTNMSHEIRTPVNSIIGMNEMILRENKNKAIEEYAYNIQNSSRMLLSLINDVLDFSAIEAGKMTLTMEGYRLDEMLNDLIHLLKQKAENKNLKINIAVDQSLPKMLEGDMLRMKQIITNLLTNAIKYTRNGHVTLRVNGEENENDILMLKVVVEDTGIGIKKEDMDKLFGSFTRLERSRNRNIEGTGLGLNITKKLIDMLEGTIEVSSNYGIGSTFTVVIPQKILDREPIGDLNKAYEKQMKDNKHYQEQFIAPALRILAVDDNEMNLKVFKGLLKKTKVQVDTASSGKDALEMCKWKQYDIIFMDHMMPEMDGVETFRELRKRTEEPNIKTPVIMLTANALSGMKEDYITQGFDDYLSKPIDASQLEMMILKYAPKDLIEVINNREALVKASLSAPDHKPDRELEKKAETKKEKLLDTKSGLMYSGGDREMYSEILSAYLEQKDRYLNGLREYMEKEDWKDYAILAHSLKSTSLTIGATELSEMAKEHEFAAKKQEINRIKNTLEELLAMYEAVLEEVSNEISGN